MDAKPFYLSKTLWVNALALAGTWFGIGELAPEEFREEIVVSVLGVVNLALRFLTKEPVKLN